MRISKIRSYISNSSGGTLIEAVITIPLVFFLIFASLNLFYTSYCGATVQFVASEAIRRANIGPPNPTPNGYNHTNSIVSFIQTRCRGLGVGVNLSDIKICPVANLNCAVSSSGLPYEVIAVKITYTVRFFIYRNIVVTGLAIGQNEPI